MIDPEVQKVLDDMHKEFEVSAKAAEEQKKNDAEANRLKKFYKENPNLSNLDVEKFSRLGYTNRMKLYNNDKNEYERLKEIWRD